MQKTTLDIIEELKKDYCVHIDAERRSFMIDNYTFSEYKDKLLVNYSVWHAVDDATDYEEEIHKSAEEVEWWVNSGRDY